MQNPSVRLHQTFPQARARVVRREKFLTPLLLMLGCALLLFAWLGTIGPRPWVDAGGYEAMLRYFLKTERVDYMQWSQPTFIGILPVAAPWALLFGSGTASLQGVGIFYALLALAGLYAFLVEHTRPAIAVLLCACLFCFSPFLPQVPTFMTDVPYLAYLVWFLAVHQNLEGAYAQSAAARRLTGLSSSRGALGPWILWALLFGLAALTRSFALVLVPVFGLQMLASRRARPTSSDVVAIEAANSSEGRHLFATRCFWMGAGIAVFSVVLTKLLGQNAFSLRNLTVIPEVLATNNFNRLEHRPALISLLLLSVASLPALLLCRPMLRGKARPGEIAIGLLGLAAGFYFWRKGLLPSFISIPGPSSVGRIVAGAQIVVVPLGLVLGIRAIRAALHVQATAPIIATEAGEPEPERARRPLTAQVVLAILLAHLLILPIMQHVDYRHTLPVFVALLMCVALAGAFSPRVPVLVATIVGLCAVCGIVATRDARLLNAATFDTAASLRRAKVPLNQIDGGWAWFCAQHLHPGTSPQSYVARSKALELQARYVVTTGAPPQGARVIRRNAVKLTGRSQTVSAFIRPASSTSSRPNKRVAPKSVPKRTKA